MNYLITYFTHFLIHYRAYSSYFALALVIKAFFYAFARASSGRFAKSRKNSFYCLGAAATIWGI
jgi:hypothetical protein